MIWIILPAAAVASFLAGYLFGWRMCVAEAGVMASELQMQDWPNLPLRPEDVRVAVGDRDRATGAPR